MRDKIITEQKEKSPQGHLPFGLDNIDLTKKITFPGKRRKFMANKNTKKALEQFKMQAASEVGVNLNNGYNGELTSRQAGSIGGQMVKKMVESYENNLKTNG